MDKFVLRGVLSGGLGGLLGFIFARIFAEPQIQAAIGYESGRDAAQDALSKGAGLAVEPDGPEIFSRALQANIGIGLGIIVMGAALGAIFAIVYAICLGRTGQIRPRALALLVAAGGFFGFYFVPFLKYPANPPAIGHADTIGPRTWLYLTMVACSLLFSVLALILGQRLKPRFGTWNASLLAGAAFAVAIGIVMFALPSLGELAANVKEFGKHASETPLPLKDDQGNIVYPGFSADVLATFRVYSILAQALIWGTIGVTFAPTADKLLAGRARTEKFTANV
ncbi:MAG: CbtA family protein [Antricoccus sp.]